VQVPYSSGRTQPKTLVSYQKHGNFTNNNIQLEKYLYTMSTATKPKHIGRNISRIRELREMKQEALAIAIGVSQQTISNIENSETVEEDKR
jgi:DNA-binding XRE family transcriptional regulator